MKIVLGAMPEVWADTLEQILEPSGTEVQRYSQGGEIPHNEEILLVYGRPEYAIEAAIVDGKDIHEAIEGWIQEAEALLQYVRRNRRQASMLHGPCVFDLSQEFCEFLDRRFQLSVSPADIAAVKRPEVDKTVFQVIAAQAVASSRELTDFVGELEASSQPIGSGPPLYLPQWAEAHVELHELEEEKKLMQTQLRQVQEELERHYLESKELKGQRDEQKSELEKLTAERNQHAQKVNELEAELEKLTQENTHASTELKEENELLLQQLHQVQEELESHYLEAKELKGQRDEQKSELETITAERDQHAQTVKELEAELERLTHENTQENTQPNKELEEENELLLLQLHQVQEELESYYLEARELRESRGGASSMEMDELLSYAVMLEHQYTKLLKSRSWKLLAPLREAGRLVKSLVRGTRVPRNRLPKRPGVLADEPVGGRYGKRTRV